ncbi:MAG: shikimate kinase [Ruminococcus sp.]|nr:shikimate kinase [Ruminococcus sp.]MBR6386090.1 shikimate kinase [Ruminococcus sp.]
MTVFLCGFMGCGKSTVGKLTAKKLGCGFFDTDELIVERENMSIPEIFAQKGEPYFRKVEAEVVKSVCGKTAVIACGGGAMLNPESAKSAAESGAVVFLDVDFDTCYERICGDSNRPIAAASSKEELLQRFNARHEIYLKHSTIQIKSNGSPVEISDIIVSSVKNYK